MENVRRLPTAIFSGTERLWGAASITASAVVALVAAAAVLLYVPSVAHAHGVVLDYNNSEAVEIEAMYDTGEPMSEAQVLVYAPDDPAEPHTTGVADEEGRYLFAPDTSQPGEWTVEVRQAGHGETIGVPVEGDEATSQEDGDGAAQSEGEEAAAAQEKGDEAAPAASVQSGDSSGGAGYSTAQIGLMSALGIWGFIGTALFFMRRGS